MNGSSLRVEGQVGDVLEVRGRSARRDNLDVRREFQELHDRPGVVQLRVVGDQVLHAQQDASDSLELGEVRVEEVKLSRDPMSVSSATLVLLNSKLVLATSGASYVEKLCDLQANST